MTSKIFSNTKPNPLVPYRIEEGFSKILVYHNAAADLDFTGTVTWIKAAGEAKSTATQRFIPDNGSNHVLETGLVPGTSYDISLSFVDLFASSNTSLLTAQYQGTPSVLTDIYDSVFTTKVPASITDVTKVTKLTKEEGSVAVTLTIANYASISKLLIEVSNDSGATWVPGYSGVSADTLDMLVPVGVYNLRLTSSITFSNGDEDIAPPVLYLGDDLDIDVVLDNSLTDINVLLNNSRGELALNLQNISIDVIDGILTQAGQNYITAEYVAEIDGFRASIDEQVGLILIEGGAVTANEFNATSLKVDTHEGEIATLIQNQTTIGDTVNVHTTSINQNATDIGLLATSLSGTDFDQISIRLNSAENSVTNSSVAVTASQIGLIDQFMSGAITSVDLIQTASSVAVAETSIQTLSDENAAQAIQITTIAATAADAVAGYQANITALANESQARASDVSTLIASIDTTNGVLDASITRISGVETLASGTASSFSVTKGQVDNATTGLSAAYSIASEAKTTADGTASSFSVTKGQVDNAFTGLGATYTLAGVAKSTADGAVQSNIDLAAVVNDPNRGLAKAFIELAAQSESIGGLTARAVFGVDAFGNFTGIEIDGGADISAIKFSGSQFTLYDPFADANALEWNGVDNEWKFSGDISAAKGTFTGALSGATITGGLIQTADYDVADLAPYPERVVIGNATYPIWFGSGAVGVEEGVTGHKFYCDSGGNIYAKDVTIEGGSTFSGNLIAAGGDFTGKVSVATSTYRFDIDMGDPAGWAVWYGLAANSADRTEANTLFGISKVSGRAYAKGMTISGDSTFTGDITSESTITGAAITGGLIQTSSSLLIPRVVINPDSTYPFWLGTGTVGGLEANNYKFFVSSAGGLHAKGLIIEGDSKFKGNITSTATITGGTLVGSSIQTALAASPDTRVELGHTDYPLWCGTGAVGTDSIFHVDSGGGATFTGTITSEAGKIGGWQLGADKLASASSGARVELDSTKQRISVFDGVGSTQVAVGYLEGLPKYDDAGNFWDSESYGFWAAAGDRIIVDGDLNYVNGNMLITGDATIKVQDMGYPTPRDIIRLGTHVGDKGLFLFDPTGQTDNPVVKREIVRVGTRAGTHGLFVIDAVGGDLFAATKDGMAIGNTASDKYLQYTTAGGLVVKGDITGSTGTFEGALNGATITGGLIQTATHTVGEVNPLSRVVLGGAVYPFWMGRGAVGGLATDDYSLYVTTDGKLYAKELHIDGTSTFAGSLSGADITGATGTFSDTLSGATISGGSITGGLIQTATHTVGEVNPLSRVVLGGAVYPFWMGRGAVGGLSTDDYSLYVTTDGKIYAKELHIDGSGTFKGSLSGADITGATGDFDGQITGGTIKIGANFDVTNTGIVTASGMTINGNSTFEGSITTGSTISGAAITAGTINIGDNFDVTNTGVVTATSINISGNSTFQGDLTGASGTFSGILSATQGNFSGGLSGADITGANGTFSGILSAATIIGGTTISGATVTGGTIQTAVNTGVNYRVEMGNATYPLWFGAGSVDAGTANFYCDFEGKLYAKGLHIDGTSEFYGELKGATGTFSGTLSASTITGSTISGNTIIGGSISIGDNFDVDNAGTVTASGMTINGNSSFNGEIVGGTITIGTDFAVTNAGRVTASQAVMDRLQATGSGSTDAINASSTSTTSVVTSINFGSGTAVVANSAAGKGMTSSGATYGVQGHANGGSGSYSFYATGNGGHATYGPFTGAHDALIPKELEIEVGDIVYDKHIVSSTGVSDVIAEVSPTTQPKQKSAVGVFVSASELDENHIPAAMESTMGYETTHLRVIMNSVGEGMMNVCGQGGDIEAGDLITSSDILGKGMKQDDDLVRNYTVAKARQDMSFNDLLEVKQIAVIYMCG